MIFRSRFAWFLTLAAGLCALGAGAADKPAATAVPGDGETLSLLVQARVFEQCGLADLAGPLYQAALKRTAEAQGAQLRPLAACEAAIYFFKIGKTAEGEALVAPLRDTLSLGANPEARCLRDLALGYGALAAGQLNAADEAQIDATREAQPKAAAVHQGDCHLLQGAIHLARKKNAEAAESGRAAVRAFTAAGLPLAVAEANRFLARALSESGDKVSASRAMAQALNAVTSLTQGPLLDPTQTGGRVAELAAGHRAAGEAKRFDEAANGALSLLILARDRARSAAAQVTAADDGPSEPVLLAYLALYAQRAGKEALAPELLALAGKGPAADAPARQRAEFEWIAARFERTRGNLEASLQRLDAADAALRNSSAAPAFLTVGVPEMRALTLAAQKNAPGTTQALQAALAAAKTANLPTDEARISGYLSEVALGNLSIGPTAGASTVSPETRRQAERQALLTQADVTIFRTPFVAAYPAGSTVAAFEALKKIPLPRPTPPSAAGSTISPDERIRLGSMYINGDSSTRDLEQFRKAIPDLLQILAREGDSAKRLEQLGICYAALGKWPEAAAAYERLLKLDSANAVKWLDQIGFCYASFDKWSEAAAAYERLLKQDPTNATAQKRLKEAQDRLGGKKSE